MHNIVLMQHKQAFNNLTQNATCWTHIHMFILSYWHRHSDCRYHRLCLRQAGLTYSKKVFFKCAILPILLMYYKTLVPVKEKTPLGNTNKWQLYEILESGVTKLGEHKKQCKDDFSLRLQSWKTECSDKNKSTRKTCCEQIVTTSRYVCKYY